MPEPPNKNPTPRFPVTVLSTKWLSPPWRIASAPGNGGVKSKGPYLKAGLDVAGRDIAVKLRPSGGRLKTQQKVIT